MEESLYLLPAAGALEEVAQPFIFPEQGPAQGVCPQPKASAPRLLGEASVAKIDLRLY